MTDTVTWEPGDCTPSAHAASEWVSAKVTDCPLCEKPRCTGRKSGSPTQRCRKRPINGGRVCRNHGGSAPQVKAAAAARVEQRRAVLAAETFGLPREVDPHTALLEELHRTAGAVEWLGAIVADLKQNVVTWGVTRRKTGGEDRGVTHEARLNAWAAEWRNERKHLLEVAKVCVAVGIEERRVRLAEDAGRQLAAVIRAVLDRLDLTDEQQRLAVVVVPEEFRRLREAGSPDTNDQPDTAGGAA